MIYLSNKKILANIFVSTTNDHPVERVSVADGTSIAKNKIAVKPHII